MPETLPIEVEDFQRFFELAPDAFWVFGYDGRIRTANAAAGRLLGYADDALKAESLTDLTHPEDRELLAVALGKLGQGIPVRSFETRFRSSEGPYRWIVWDATPVADRRLVFATAHDITDQIARHEHRFRKVFENSKDGVILIDGKTGYLIEANAPAADLLGLIPDQLETTLLWELELFREGLGKEILSALETDETFRRETVLRQGNANRHVELLCNAYADGRSRLIQCSLRDISQRKRAETALRESEERFRVLVDGVRDYAIFMMDPAGTIVSWNPGAERIIGYCEEEALGKNGRMIFTPEDIAAGKADGELHQAEGEGRAEDERWHLRKDGSRFFASGVLTSLWQPDGSLRGFAKVMRDVTDRKKNEEAMREAQKLESIGLLAGGVAHDFNNLLTGIMGNASLMLDDSAPASPNHRLIQNVISASKRAADLTRQLLAYAGKGRFAVRVFPISQVVSEILDLIHASIPESIQLELAMDDQQSLVEADPTQVQQVVMNLVINAAEATEGDGKIRISTGQRWLSAADLAGMEGTNHLMPGAYVYLEVNDSGSGMAPETRSKIFDPFFTTKFTGRGLGLAAVSGIVRGHGGGIHVASMPGQGSCFQVFLPAVTQTGEPKSSLEDDARDATLILVADDEEVVRDVARDALERHGYAVLLAKNGREAVELFQKNADRVQAIVLDMAMPVMSGEDAFRQLKELRPDLPVLIASGYSEMMMTQRFGGPDGKSFIQKPFTAAELAQSVTALLNSK